MRRTKIQIKLQDNFNDPALQVAILKTLDDLKKYLLMPEMERCDIRDKIFQIAELEKELTKTEKYVDIQLGYRVEYNVGLGFSELFIEGNNEGVCDRGTGINVIAFGRKDYYQDMITLYNKYKGQDEGSVISGARVVNLQDSQVLCSQICQGSITNQLYFEEACDIIKKHTAYDPEILPGRMD